MTTWIYDGVDLSTLGIVTVIDGYLDIPERRGNNVVVPFRHGALYRERYFDVRTLTIGIAVVGDDLADLEGKMQTIQRLFASRGQKTLSIIYEDATTKTAQVAVNKSMQMTRTKTMARLVVEFEMCEPFFRDSVPIADNTTMIDTSPKTMIVTNPGTMEERDPTIVLTGPLQDVIITNNTVGCVLTYDGIIDGGHVVTIGTLNGEYYATHSVDGNVIGAITHEGSPALMVLQPGDNSLSISSVITTTGTVKITFYPPYL